MNKGTKKQGNKEKNEQRKKRNIGTKEQSPPQGLEVGPRSGPYLLVFIQFLLLKLYTLLLETVLYLTSQDSLKYYTLRFMKKCL